MLLRWLAAIWAPCPVTPIHLTRPCSRASTAASIAPPGLRAMSHSMGSARLCSCQRSTWSTPNLSSDRCSSARASAALRCPVLVARKNESRAAPRNQGLTRSSASPYDAATSMWLIPCRISTPSERAALRSRQREAAVRKCCDRVGDHDLRPAEVSERKPIARGLGSGSAPKHLSQVPVHPLVAVEEPQHLAALAERDGLGHPLESPPRSRVAPGRVVDGLVKWAEWFGHPQHDAPEVELAQGRKAWARPVTKRLHDHLVVARRR